MAAGDLQPALEHRGLLDIIDRLRSKGIGRYVDLPQIIVCGDQSSGKSSVLEAISGMSFPTKDQLCTRFATELILRRSSTPNIKVSISADHDRPEPEKATLGKFGYAGDDVNLAQIVENARVAMGLAGEGGKAFSKDVLRVEISGPTQPHLTMVDLPGLFLAGNKNQSAADSALVKSLVLDYMKQPRSIIMAVISAKSDFALQQVTEHTRAVDPIGHRTLGLITKPDTLDKGSDSERFYVDLAQNKDVSFRLGWHVLRNRGYVTRNATSTERDTEEENFFANGIWKDVKPSQLGVKALKSRLASVLKEQILNQLPHVLKDAKEGVDECRTRLEKLGPSRNTPAEQRRYLLRASERFSTCIKAAVNGEYTDAFFGDSSTDSGYQKRLRAVVQYRLSDFAKDMHRDGHSRRIVESRPAGPKTILRSDYMVEVQRMMKRSRGLELPGTFNPLVVSEMFSKQCVPWKAIAQGVTDATIGDTEATLNHILQHIVDERTAANLMEAVVAPAMDTIRASLKAKADELLEPHLSIHPITYNRYLTDKIQQAQLNRRKIGLEKRVGTAFNAHSAHDWKSVHLTAVTPAQVLNIAQDDPESNMADYACSLAIDTMEAYYEVALQRFIDDISVLAIEQCLLQKLPNIFRAEIVFDLEEDKVQQIANECSDSAAERATAQEKLKILEDAMGELNELKKFSNPQGDVNLGDKRRLSSLSR